MSSRETVLVVCSFVPFPAHRGDPVRVLGLLDALGERSSVTVWCVESDGSDVPGLRERLRGSAVRVFKRSYVRRWGTVSDVLRYLRSVVKSTPSWIQKRESYDLVQALKSAEAQFDKILILGEASGIYALEAGLSSWHWDKFNVMAVSQSYTDGQRRNPASWFMHLVNVRAVHKFELRGVRSASTLSVTNNDERNRIGQVYGRGAAIIVSSVPLPPVERSDNERPAIDNSVLWLGNLTYESNLSGLLRFLEEGWPERKLAEELRIVGSGLSGDLRRYLDEFDGVEVVGHVDDLSVEHGRSAVGLVPLWSGGGTKMKTLTMMSYGLPIVSTTSGVEGIPGAAQFIRIGESPVELMREVDAVLAREDRAKMGADGRSLIEREFSTPVVRLQIEQLFR